MSNVGRHSVDVVFLDQNKWIELAKVAAGKTTSGNIATLYSQLTVAVDAGKVIFPLAVSHVIETSKRNDPTSRALLAETQARLSRGCVYRSRAGRLLVEMQQTIRKLFGEPLAELPDNWVIASGFMQAFEPMDTIFASPAEAERVRRFNRLVDPRVQYIDYMKNQDEATRRSAHVKFTAGAAKLIEGIEKRRALLRGDPTDVRRRAYNVKLFLDHQDDMIKATLALGHTFEELQALGEKAMVALIEDVPTLNVEAEMAARLESETRPIDANDVIDMQSFYTAIPYSNRVVAEKASISRARQAKLDARYPVLLSERLESLLDVYLEE